MRPDSFRAGLDSLEGLLDDALQACGETRGARGGEGPIVRVAEGALDLYARLGRTLQEKSVAAALAELGARRGGDPDDFGHDPDFENALLPLLRFLYRSWWRVETEGIDRVPLEGPAVLVANHSGSLFAYDGAMLRLAMRYRHPAHRSVRPMLDEAIFEQPVLGEVMGRCGAVRAGEPNGDVLLAHGQVVACFPEGPEALGRAFRRRYEIGPFDDGGFVRMALRAGAPILPVAIVGAEETHPVLARLDWIARRIGVPYVPVTPTFPWLGVGGLLPLPSRWRIEVGNPVEALAHLTPDAADDARLVRRLTERVRRQVQTLVAATRERRGRPFF